MDTFKKTLSKCIIIKGEGGELDIEYKLKKNEDL